MSLFGKKKDNSAPVETNASVQTTQPSPQAGQPAAQPAQTAPAAQPGTPAQTAATGATQTGASAQEVIADVNQQSSRFNAGLAAAKDANASTSQKVEQAAEVQYDSQGRVKRPTKPFKFTITNDVGKKITCNVEAESEAEIRQYLESNKYDIVSVVPRSKTDVDINIGGLKASDLSFSLTQLSTYIKSGIPLADAVGILAKQATKPALRNSFHQLDFELLKGENLSDAMADQGSTYPQLLVNMVKTAEMTGDLPSILDDMSDYYTAIDQTKKQMKSAMMYPLIVLTIAFGVLIFMLTYLVPQFTSMFAENGGELPALTRFIVAVSAFLTQNWWKLLIIIAVIVITFIVCFKKIKPFKKKVQILLMHLPVSKDIIIYNEIANFTKTFASLLNHGVYITDSMDVLQQITNNEVYKDIIQSCLTNLAKGETVSSAFRGQWAVPVVAYEMIVTGEKTGQLGQMMEKVASHFQMLHKNVIDQMKSMIEPFLIVFLAVVVGTILLSIIQPMFAIYDTVQ